MICTMAVISPFCCTYNIYIIVCLARIVLGIMVRHVQIEQARDKEQMRFEFTFVSWCLVQG